MGLSRRQVFRNAAGGAALAALHATWSRITFAQDYPSRPVRWLLGYTTGGTTDIISRLVTQPLTERLGRAPVHEVQNSRAPGVDTRRLVHAWLWRTRSVNAFRTTRCAELGRVSTDRTRKARALLRSPPCHQLPARMK